MKVIHERQLPRIIAVSTELGCLTALVNTGLIKPYISKKEACNLYGNEKVDQWLSAGDVSIEPAENKQGRGRLNRLTLELLETASQIADCLEDYKPPFYARFFNSK